MKRSIAVFVLAATMLVSVNSFAQKAYKFGHIDSNQLLSTMPERESVKSKLEAFAKQLENQLAAMQTELESKYQQYMSEAETLSPLIRQTKEQELTEMQQRIQMFQQNAQQELGAKESELFQPVIDKARKAISEVANENGFTYVFDIGSGAVLHFSDDSQDILPLVKAKLGIQ